MIPNCQEAGIPESGGIPSADRRLAERRRRIRTRLIPAASGLVVLIGILILLVIKLAGPGPTVASHDFPPSATSSAAGGPQHYSAAVDTGLGGLDMDADQAGTDQAPWTHQAQSIDQGAKTDEGSGSSSPPGTAQTAGSGPAKVVTKGPQGRMQVALTFDNNYQSAGSLQMIQTLKNAGVPATLFLVGDLVTKTPQLTAAIAGAGLEVGDATFSYTECNAVSVDWQRQEIGEGSSAYEKSTGKKAATLFRPPYGTYNDTTLLVAAEKGLSHVVLWDVDSHDAMGISSDEIVANVLGNVHDGAIILLHLDGANTARALPRIISGLEEKGFTLVTVSELLASS